jgi:hypothetical protein
MTVLVRKRSPTEARSATFTSTGRELAIPKNHFSATRRGQRPIPLKEQEVEEAAMPGQPFTRSRAFPIFPRRFTLENRQLPPASPLSSFSESESFSRMR